MDRAKVRWLRLLDSMGMATTQVSWSVGKYVFSAGFSWKPEARKQNKGHAVVPQTATDLGTYPSSNQVFRDLSGPAWNNMKQLSLFRALDSLDTVQCWGIWIGSRENVQANVQENVFFFVCVSENAGYRLLCPKKYGKSWENIKFGYPIFRHTETHSTSPVEKGASRGIPSCEATRPPVTTRDRMAGMEMGIWRICAIFNRYKWCGKPRPRNQGLSNGRVWNKASQNWVMVYIIVPIVPIQMADVISQFSDTHISHTVA